MSIEKFPQFKALTLNDYPVLADIFKDNPPQISEFTFTNLYAWRNPYKIFISALDDFIILRSDKYSPQKFFIPIGKGNIKALMERLMVQQRAVFFRVPQEVKVLFEADTKFLAEFDPDNSDYVYNISDLVNLSGRNYDGKRNLIKKFKSGNSYEYIDLNSGNIDLCLKFEENWCSIKNCDSSEGLSNEKAAIRDMVDNFSRFGLIGAAIKIKEGIFAVAIAQELNPQTLVMHVLKADPNITGLYQVILQDFLRTQAGKYKYVNLEQDLGIEGIRKSKLSYHPSFMVNKYNLCLK